MRYLIKPLVALCTVLLAEQTFAHGRMLEPSHTIVSGDEPIAISVSYSITNDVFHPDNGPGGIPLAKLAQLQRGEIAAAEVFRAPPPSNGRRPPFRPLKLTVTAPDGSVDDSMPFVNFGRTTASQANLEQDGTYRIGVVSPLVMTTFKTPDGKRNRLFGPVEQLQLPEGATNVFEITSYANIETYVTRNDISDTVLKPTGEGLELVFAGHPNELFVGETTGIQVLFEGKPVGEGTELILTRAGTRWRNDRDSRTLTTDADGNVTMAWDYAGYWLLEVEFSHPVRTKTSATRYQRYVTLEVNPE